MKSTNKDFYPLKKYMGNKPILLVGTWYVVPNERFLDVEKIESKHSPCRGWIENYDGYAYICGDLPNYVYKAYDRFIDNHTQLIAPSKRKW